MGIEKFVIYFLLLVAAWLILHYLFLWMEKKGWIYYKTKPRGGGLGNALHELNAILNPSARPAVERQFEQKEEDKADDDKNRIK